MARRQQIRGRVALVTGAARGIGYATAAALRAAGATVVLADIDADGVTAAAARLGPDTSGWALDVTDPDAFAGVVARAETTFGAVDILVNNAGIMPIGGFLEQPLAMDRRQIDINLFGVLHGMRAALPGMLARRRGHVVNMASVAGRVGAPYVAVYSAAKHAVIGLTEAARYEYEDTGVGFSYVLPAFVDTELISGTGRVRWPPPVKPEDVARAVVHAIRRGKVDVFVPRASRISVILPALLPRPAYEAIGRVLGLADMFRHVDDAERKAYRTRITA